MAKCIILTFLISFLLLPGNSRLQAQEALSHPEKADTAAIFGCIRKGQRYRFSAPDSARYFYQMAMALSNDAGYNEGIAASMLSDAALDLDRGEMIKAVSTLRKSEPYCSRSTYKNGLHEVMLNNSLGVAYSRFGLFDTAILYYYKALKIYEQNKMIDSALLLQLHNNIGGTLVTDMRYTESLYYLKKAEVIANQTKAEKTIGITYVNMGIAYNGNQMSDEAFRYINKALKLSRTFKDKALEAFAEYTMGVLLLEQNNAQTSIMHFQRALTIDNSDVQTSQIANRGLAAAYGKLKNYTLAEVHYLRTLSAVQKGNKIRDLAEVYNELAGIYLQMQDFKNAFYYKDNYSNLRDSILNAEKNMATSQLEVKYRTAEKDKEIAKKQLLLNEQQFVLNKKNWWIAIALISTFFLIILVCSLYIGFRRKQKLQDSEINRLQHERELIKLKAIMSGEEKERMRIARELHDGIMVQFSSVKMNLSAMMNKALQHEQSDEMKGIVAQLDAATRELRTSAHNLLPDMLLEEGLCEAVHYFCNNLQQSAGIKIDFQQYGHLPIVVKEYELVMYRIIQELLNNVVKHANATIALVQISCQEHLLGITIEDNGIGFIEQELPANKGMGLVSIRARVQLLRGRIDLSSAKNVGTTVYIEFETDHLQKSEI